MATTAQPRPLTDAEYAALTRKQRIALGLDEDDSGAPADFNGTVLPNPNHLKPALDTDSGIQPTRLPNGVNFNRGNFSGKVPGDISNPAASQMLPSAMREVGADMSAQPTSLPPLPKGYSLDQASASSALPPLPKGYTLDSGSSEKPETPSLLNRLATQPSEFSHANPLRYFDELGQGMAKGVDALAHPIDTAKQTYDFLAAGLKPQGPSPDMSLGDVADTIVKSYGQAATGAVAGKVAGATAGAASDVVQAATKRAIDAAVKMTPKQLAQSVGGTTGAVAGHGVLSPIGAAVGIKHFGDVAEILLGKDRANTPIFQKAASLDDAADAVAQTIGQNRKATTGAAPKFTTADRAAAKSLLQDALAQHTGDVIDNAISGNAEQAAQTKGAVEYYLKRADVEGAERALDKGAKAANPAWQPLERQPVPSTNEIRARVQAEAKAPQVGSAQDKLDTHALQQEMQWNLERHGWSAESEARREFIARNSSGMTKAELAKRFAATSGKGIPAAGSASATGTSEDLTDILQKSLDQARKQSGQK